MSYIFTLLNQDYIVCTLIGLLIGIVGGRYLCKQFKKEENTNKKK